MTKHDFTHTKHALYGNPGVTKGSKMQIPYNKKGLYRYILKHYGAVFPLTNNVLTQLNFLILHTLNVNHSKAASISQHAGTILQQHVKVKPSVLQTESL